MMWQQFSKMEGNPGDEDWGVVLDAAELSEAFSSIGVSTEKNDCCLWEPKCLGRRRENYLDASASGC
ncbi:hypothetical protein KHA80_22810 [Anaerobacillus sp. HL2]|nr:hypothetical protein KHA80_22810 [Anaerobacillus sp. HL2]